MALPLLYGLIVLGTYVFHIARAAALTRALWHAMTVMRASGAGARMINSLRMIGDRMIQIGYRGVDYTIKATRGGEVTLRAANGKEVPKELVQFVVKEVMPRAKGFQGLYNKAPAAVTRKPDLELLWKVGGS